MLNACCWRARGRLEGEAGLKSRAIMPSDATDTAHVTSWRTITVYCILASYALAFQMQQPLVPYLVRELGADSSSFAHLSSFFSFIQLIGGLLSGVLSDSFGAKALLALSLSSSALSYALSASATSIWFLYVARVPTILQHAMLASRIIVSEDAREKDRASALGYCMVAYGCGFAVGPALGGLLSRVTLQTAAWVAAAASAVSTIVALLLPASPRDGVREHVHTSRSAGSFGWRSLLATVNSRTVVGLLTVKTIAGFSSALLYSSLSLLAMDTFGLSAEENGWLTSYVGVLTIATQAVLIGWATRNFSDDVIMRVSMVGFMVAFVACGFCSTVMHFGVVLLPLLAFGALLQNVNTAALTKSVDEQRLGTIMGVDMALGSALRIPTPSLAAYLLSRYGLMGLTTCAALLCAVISVCFALDALPTHADDRRKQH